MICLFHVPVSMSVINSYSKATNTEDFPSYSITIKCRKERTKLIADTLYKRMYVRYNGAVKSTSLEHITNLNIPKIPHPRESEREGGRGERERESKQETRITFFTTACSAKYIPCITVSTKAVPQTTI